MKSANSFRLSVLSRLFPLAALGILALPAAAQTVTATLPTLATPWAAAVNPVTGKIYIAHYATPGFVTIVGGATQAKSTVLVGNLPDALAVNPATNKIYVANSSSNTVSVIDGASGAVSATVTVGATPYALAVNPVTNKIYVGNDGGASVTVIDGATNTTATVATGTWPDSLAVNPVTNKIYVGNNGSGSVTVIDGATNGTTTIAAGSAPLAVAVNPVTNKIYVANNGAASVSVIDGAAGTVSATVPVGVSPRALAVNPVTNRIYVANSSGNSVTVINGATGAVAATVAAGNGPLALAVNPVNNKIFVANSGAGNLVTVIDGNTNLAASLPAGAGSRAVAVNPLSDKIYVANANGGSVTVIDGASNGTATASPTGNSPSSAAVNPVTNKIYTANLGGDSVTVVDGATNGVTQIPVGSLPWAIALNPITNKIYTANFGGNSVSVIDGASGAVSATLAVGAGPQAVAVNPVTNKIYTANSNGASVTVIDGATLTAATVTAGAGAQALALNPVTNKIYCANGTGNSVTVIDGATNGTATVATGAGPQALALNSVTNKIYAVNAAGNSVTVIDGVTNGAATVAVGAGPYAAAVNPANNKIYVTNETAGTVSVIDGGTNAVAPVTVGAAPRGIAVNPVTNKIYVANNTGNTITVIDGITNAASTVAAGGGPSAVEVNPFTQKIYVTNANTATVTALSEQAVQAIPLTTAITPLAGNQTANPSQVMTFTAASAYSPTAPPVRAVYFQFDGWQGAWLSATYNAGPANWTGAAPALSAGLHVVYAFAADAQDATSINTASSPIPGQITAYLFLVTAAPIVINTASLPNGEIGLAYSQSFSASGGTGTGYGWSVVSGLPAGLSLSPAGLLSGTPSSAGAASLTVRVTDSGANTVTRAYGFTIYPALAATGGTLPDGEAGIAYNRVLTASGGAGGNAWSAVSGFPVWLAISSSGTLAGTPAAAGPVSLTAKVTDALGGAVSPAYNFSIQPAVGVATASLPNGSLGVFYSQSLAASGGVASFTWVIFSGALPAGIGLAANGTLSGTPTAFGAFNFTVQVSDGVGGSATRALSLTVIPQLALITTTLPIGYLNVAYPATALQVAGGTAPYSFQLLSGIFPSGLVFNGATGTISGTPVALASPVLNFQVTDNVGATATRSLTLTVSDPPTPGTWQPRAIFGGDIRHIAASPNYAADGIVFAAGTQGEIFRTADRGLNWSRSLVDTAHAGTTLNSLVLSPVFAGGAATIDGRTLFAASEEIAVWKSEDGGATFVKKSVGLPCNGDIACWATPWTRALAISPNYANDHTLWLLALVGANQPFVIFKTVNGGDTWSRAGTIPYCSTYDKHLMAAAPDYPASLLLLLTACDQVYRSTDSGATWNFVYSPAGGAAGNGLDNLRFSPAFSADRTVVVEDHSARLHRSRDGGQTFSLLSYGALNLTVASRPALPPVWYFFKAAAGSPAPPPYNLMRSEDGLATASPLYDTGFSVQYRNDLGALTSAATGAIPDLYLGTSFGLFASFDEGASFSSRASGISAHRIARLAGSGNQVAACDTGSPSWFKSSDAGASWTKLSSPATLFCSVIALSPDYANDRVVFIGDRFNGLYRSANDGQSFSLALNKNVMTIAFAPGFLNGVGILFAGANDGLYKSLDGGLSFSKITTLTAPNCVVSFAGGESVGSVAISPAFSTDQTLFVSSYTNGTEGGLCKSVNGGGSWSSVLVGGVRRDGPLSLSPVYNEAGVNNSAARTLFINQAYSVYRSRDGGASWSTPSVPATSTVLNGYTVFSPNYSTDNTVFITSGYAGSGIANTQFNGLLRSGDGGASFNLLSAGDQLATRTLSGLYLPPGFNGTGGLSTAVATTFGSGLWRSTDSGNSFIPTTDLKFASKFINGVARAPGGALGFASGVGGGSLLAATGDQGVFQSDDNGITFTQISQGLPANANAAAIAVPSLATIAPLTAVKTAAGAPQGLWKYNGSVWAQQTGANLSATGTYTSFLEDGTNLYATRADGVSVKSADGGVNWTALQSTETDLVKMDFNSQTTPTFLSDPAVKVQGPLPHAANAVTASLWAVSQSAGPRYSLDSGTTWTATPGTNDYVLPGGQSWSVIRALGVNAASGSREVVAGSATGLFRSNDGGASWRNVSGTGSGLEATSKNFSSAVSTVTSFGNTDLLIGATGAANGGVYLSGDGGEHWTQVNAGFDPANLSISSLIKTSCAGCPVQYYSGSYGGGMYTRTISVVAPPAFPVTNYSCYGVTPCSCATGGGSGPEQGGQAFQLCGSNFQAGAVIEFDGVPATGCTATATTITCTGTPPHAPGLANIRVRNPDTRIGYLPAQYTYTTGTSRASLLRVAKAGANAALTWSCAGCTTNPALVYRAQNVSFSAYLEQYNGGIGGAYTNSGAVATAQSYFWSVE